MSECYMDEVEYWLFFLIFTLVFFTNRLVFAVSEHLFSLGKRLDNTQYSNSNVFLNVRIKI